MQTPAGPRPGRGSRAWGEQLPLALGAVLVVAGVVIVAAVLLRPAAPRQTGPTAFASPSSTATEPEASGTPLVTPGASPSATVTATAQPTPRVVAESAMDLTWQSVALLQGTDTGAAQSLVVSGVAHGPDGYVAVGQVIDGFLTETGATGPIQPGVWTSTDGTAWQRTRVRALGAAIPTAVAATSSASLILASTPDAVILLRSSGDGEWAPATPPDARVLRVAAAGPGFVAIGERLSSHRQAIWSSSDGSAWRRTWESDVELGEFLNTVSGRADGSVVVGGTQLRVESGIQATALVSTDGLSWQRVDPDTLPQTMGFDTIGVGADGAWYGAGFDDALGGIGIWRSPDGTAWSPTTFGSGQGTELPGDTGSATAIFGFDGRTIVLAYTSCCGDPPQRELVSLDGAQWARVDRSSAVRSARLTALLVEDDRVLAVGAINRAAGVWVATAAPRSGVEFATELAPPDRSQVCGSGDALTVGVEVDRSGTVSRIRLVRPDEEGGELTGVVWPYGWRVVAGPPLRIRDAQGHVVITEGDELTLDGGVAIGGSYHLCRLNGDQVWGG